MKTVKYKLLSLIIGMMVMLGSDTFTVSFSFGDGWIDGLLSKNESVVQDTQVQLQSLGEQAIPILEEILNHKEWVARWHAVQVLGKIPVKKSTVLLLKAVYENKEPAIKSAALVGLQDRSISDKDLIRLLKDEAIECEAVGLLEGKTISDSVIEVLWNKLKPQSEEEKERHYRGVPVRESIVKLLAKNKNINSEVKLRMLLDALRNECDHPISEKLHGYVTESEYLIRQYVFALENIGPSVIPSIKEILGSAGGKFRNRLIVVLGSLDDETVYWDLKEMLTKSDDGFTRAAAARALGKLGNKDAIPVLREALKDTFVRNDGSCIVAPGLSNKVYPVREEAASSLRALDVKVKRQENEFDVER